jgi:pyruvate formate lyase activating enzyme
MENHNRMDNTGPGKFYRESPYAVAAAKGVQCRICPNNCILQEGIVSMCHTHTVKNGKLYTMAYGNPCTTHVDPVEKKPLFHFLPGSGCFSIATAGCNLSCRNCQNWEISQHGPAEVRNLELFPEKVVEEALKSRSESIAYTYSEPIVFYEYMYDTAKIASTRGINNLLISNGYINEKPLLDLCRYLDAANIDLKSFSDQTYVKLSGGKLQPVLNTLKVLRAEGVWLEITNLIIPGWSDDLNMIGEMCAWLVTNGFADTPIHFSRFHPMHKLAGVVVTPLETLENARNIALENGMRFVYLGNVPHSDAENTICPSCKKIVIERHGFTILSYNIRNGSCGFCNNLIPGVWDGISHRQRRINADVL